MILRAVAVGAFTLVLAGCIKQTVASAPMDVIVGRVDHRQVEIAGSGSSEGHAIWDTNDEVDVEWRGRWWPATVLDRKGSGRYLVHYDGYSDDWDEVVAPERIRVRTNGSPEETNDPVETDADP